MNVYSTWYDGVLGQLSIAAGQPEAARQRLDTALAFARKTGMCFHDAELLRLRAHTHTDPSACHADLDAALELSRRQGATLFELRAALDDFELRWEDRERYPASPPAPLSSTWSAACLPLARGRNSRGPKPASLNIPHDSETGPVATRCESHTR